MKILFLLLSATICFAQNPVLIDERDVTVIKVKPEQPGTLGLAKGTSYVPAYITLEGIDTSKAYKVTITVLPVTPSAPVIETVDAIPSTVQFTNWTLPTSPHGNWYGGTISYSNVVNSTATFNFTGKKIEIYAERRNTHGVGTIYFSDGSKDAIAFNTAPFGLKQLIYSKEWPTSAPRWVKIEVRQGYNLLDYFDVTK